ncbi:hypothetical protein HNR60_002324 [Rhodopseudomonas rhenobacensis]|uniref:RiboL-PSP-HEPN domain-containing protein n=1 Tax=Rhodopseudomonas rhenobacensis TaxID=87461 RepID=A0A7W8DZ82_9BRAD|nr:hypothetical protein [Rhodopseudomonas rhenobacensis]MBB5047567.1 hypothetical protein [Rhodopseudomonas rhenobacensis]
MTVALVDFVNEAPPVSKLGAVPQYLRPCVGGSAIDVFLRRVRETLSYGSSTTLISNDFIGRLLVLGVVAASEAYFREVLSQSMTLCPVARSAAAAKTINLGGLLWHGREGFSRSAFDNSSFSSAKELKSAAQEYIGFKLAESSFGALLQEFDKVCQIRHGIVHGDGVLPGKNAVQLDVPPQQTPVMIVVRFDQLQEVASVVTTLVVTFNRELFALMCQRWAIEWRKRDDWRPDLEGILFSRIWKVFLSEEERKVRKGKSKLTKQACMAATRNQFGI